MQIVDDPFSFTPAAVISSVNAAGAIQDGVFASEADWGVVEAAAAEFGRELDDEVRRVIIYLDGGVRASDERVVGPVGGNGVDRFGEGAAGDDHLLEHRPEVGPCFVGIGLEVLGEGGLGEDDETRAWQGGGVYGCVVDDIGGIREGSGVCEWV